MVWAERLGSEMALASLPVEQIARIPDVLALDRLAPEPEMLALLEAFGYVDNVHSMGMDQTQAYTGVEQPAFIEYDPSNPTYFISENGKRRVLADIASDEAEAASPE